MRLLPQNRHMKGPAMSPYEASSHDLTLLLVVIGIFTVVLLAFQAGRKK